MAVRPSVSGVAVRLVSRPLVLMAAGYAAGDAFAVTGRSGWGLALISASACLLLLAARRGRRWRAALQAGLLVTALTATGLWRGYTSELAGAREPSLWANERFVDLTGTVNAEPIPTGAGRTLIVHGERIAWGGGTTAAVDRDVAVTLPVGAGADRVQPGDRVIVHGHLERLRPATNPDSFDPELYWRARAVAATLRVRLRSDLVVLGPGAPRPMDRLAAVLRGSFLDAMGRVLSHENRNLLAGIALGSRSQMPARVEDDFVRTGTVHVLATAGLHVAILAAALFSMWRTLWLPGRWAAVATILCLIVYASAAGGRPAVSRAVLMASVYLGAYILDREPDGPTALAAAALWLLGRSPGLLLDVGFQLTFVTVAVLLALLCGVRTLAVDAPAQERPGAGLSERLRGRARDIAMLSLCAQLGAAGLTAEYFHIFSPMSLVANLIAVPLVCVVLLLSLALWPAAILFPVPAKIAAGLTIGPLLSFLITAIHALAAVPGTAWSVASPGWPLLVVYYGVLFAAALIVQGRRQGTFRTAGPDAREAA